MENTRNIVLIGFMGAGKSTVAAALHDIHGYEVVEMDALIEEREGMSIPEIFAQKGEAYFRDAETKLLTELQTRDHTVISCGGGTPLRQQNVAEMKKIGVVILLTAEPETILSRVQDSHDRPLIEGHKDAGYIASLLAQRMPKYEAAADFVIPTDGLSAEEICSRILSAE